MIDTNLIRVDDFSTSSFDIKLKEKIMEAIPQKAPFRFIDDLYEINENFILGSYTYKTDEFFYKGHFPDNPITPGVILVETMAQIGVLALGIYITKQYENKLKVFFTSSDVSYKRQVFPGEKVIVESEKIFFRANKLKCKVKMRNISNEIICSGILSGVFINNNERKLK